VGSEMCIRDRVKGALHCVIGPVDAFAGLWSTCRLVGVP